jgi:dolichol-phosphate mannosyltransferase
MRLATQYLRFVLVSGGGLCIALALLWTGVHLVHLSVGVANAVGDAVAVTFVFLISERGVFTSHGRGLLAKYGLWLIWQALLILLVSLTLQWLNAQVAGGGVNGWRDIPETVLKLLLTPFTLSLNFVAARLLLHRAEAGSASTGAGAKAGPQDRSSDRPDRHGKARILVFIPAYQCEQQIPRVLGSFDNPAIARHFAEILVLDNGSRDNTVAAASAAAQRLTGLSVRVARNRDNYGLGGSHKSAFAYAVANHFSHVVVLHGDDQGDIRDLLPVLDADLHWRHDCCLGSRFMQGSRRSGYSTFRTFGNRVFNLLYSIAAWNPVHDLGAGLNIYATSFLRDDFYHRYHDGLHFNCFLLLGSFARRARLMFFPVSWREEDQVSNVRMFRQAFQTLELAIRSVLDRRRFFAAEHRERIHERYVFDTLFVNGAEPTAADAGGVGA